MQRDNVLNLLAVAIAWLCALFIIGLAALALNRGFDTMVEGYYLLSYANPDRYLNFSAFPILLSRFPRLLALDLAHYRLVDIILRLCAGVVLIWGMASWVKRKEPQLVDAIDIAQLIALTILGTAMAYAIGPRCASYNTLATFCVLCVAGVIGWAAQQSKLPAIAAFFSLAGFIIGFCFFAKFTSAALLGLVTLGFGFILFRPKFAQILVSLTLGCLAAVGVYHVCFQPLNLWYGLFLPAVSGEASSSHGLLRMMLVFLPQNGRAALALGLTVLGGGVLALLARRASGKNLVPGLYAALSFILIPVLVILDRGAIYPLAIVVLLMAPFAAKGQGIERHLLFAILGLLSLPVISSFGTNVDIIPHTFTTAAPFFIAAFLLAAVYARGEGPKWIKPCTTLALSVFAVVQFIKGFVLYAFDLPTNLMAQSELVTAPQRVNGLYLDANSKRILDEFAKILNANSFQQGDPILPMFDESGFVYAVGGVSISEAWFPRMSDRLGLYCRAIRDIPNHRFDRLYLVVANTVDPGDLPLEVRNCFGEISLPFPAAFDQIGTVYDAQHETVALTIFKAKNEALAAMRSSQK